MVIVLIVVACSSEVVPPPSPRFPAVEFTRGPMPDSARRADGSIDLSEVPDFIPAVDGDRNAGWIWSADVLPVFGEERTEIVTVYADDLTTVVGQMFPDVGYVALGSGEEMLRDPHRNRELTIRVRNESSEPAVLEITQPRDEPNWGPGLIAPPIVVPEGSEEDVTLRASRDRWSLNLRGDHGFFFSDDLGRWATDSGFSLVIGRDGVLGVDR